MPRLRHLLPPLLLIGAGLTLYLLTLAPGVTGVDAGELILAATSRGVAHAPGFPTWLILATPFSHLPWREPAWRLNFLSALCGAFTLAALWFWLRQLPLPTPQLPPALRPSSHRAPSSPSQPGNHLTLIVALTFTVSRTFWPWATATEVYTLNTLLLAATLALLFAWSNPLAFAPDHPRRTRPILLILAALVYGLALGAQLATTALLAPAIALWLYWQRSRLNLRLFLLAALALLLGFSVYAALPLRAAAAPLLNWGEPDTPYRFWRHLTAAQYHSNLSFDPASLLHELRFGATLTFWQYSPLALPFIAWGLWWGWSQQRRPTLFVLVGILTGLAYAILYAIEDDQDAYYILPHLLLLAPLLWGLQLGLLALSRRLLIPTARRNAALHLLLWLLPLCALLLNLPGANRRDYHYHSDYYHNLTAEVAPGGAIFTRDWQFYSPSLYYQHVLGDRLDLHIIDVELMRRDWYLDQLERWYPDLTQPAAAELSAYRQQRDAWERDPQSIESNPLRVAALQNAYIAAIDALIWAADTLGDVHLGPDMEQGIAAGYSWVPAGLTFRLDPPSSHPPLPPLHWDLSHLQGRWHRLPDDPARKVARAHALMLDNRAIYLARLGDLAARADALSALDLALQLDPTDTLALSLRQQIQAQ